LSSKIIKKQFVNLNPPRVFEIHPKNEDNSKDNVSIDNLKKELEKKKKEYELKIAEARKEANKIIENAKKEAELLKEDVFSRAKEEGFDIGYDEGMEKSKKDINEWINQFQSLIERIENEEKSLLEYNKKFIHKLIKILAEKIINKELNESSETIVLKAIENISKEISGKSEIKIQVSKNDYENIIEKYENIKSMFLGSDNLVIKPDNSLKPGDLFIDTEIGSYDAIIENKIEEAFKLFNEGSGGA
jgi:flagellar assembly protein FliH